MKQKKVHNTTNTNKRPNHPPNQPTNNQQPTKKTNQLTKSERSLEVKSNPGLSASDMLFGDLLLSPCTMEKSRAPKWNKLGVARKLLEQTKTGFCWLTIDLIRLIILIDFIDLVLYWDRHRHALAHPITWCCLMKRASNDGSRQPHHTLRATHGTLSATGAAGWKKAQPRLPHVDRSMRKDSEKITTRGKTQNKTVENCNRCAYMPIGSIMRNPKNMSYTLSSSLFLVDPWKLNGTGKRLPIWMDGILH